MNTDELFAAGKRSADGDEPESRKKHQSGDPNHKILEFLQNDSEQDPAANVHYDRNWLKKTLTKVENLLSKNVELREKYHDKEPLKFMENEFELYQSIKGLSEIGIALDECDDYEECYSELCSNSTFIEAIGLISTHPNADISQQMLSVLNDIVEDEEVDLDRASYKHSKLADLFVKTDIAQVLADFLIKKAPLLEDDAQSVSLCLTILVNLNDYDSNKLQDTFLRNRALNGWILKHISGFKQVSQITEITQFSAEYLNTLLLTAAIEQLQTFENSLGEQDIVELLMIVFSRLKKATIAKNSEVEEFAENAIQLLCHLISASSEYNERFVENEGIELVLLVLDISFSKWHVRNGFKILAFALTDNSMATKMVESGLLKPLFKNLPSGKPPKEVDSTENYVLVILSKLFKFLPLTSDEHIRVMNKMVHKDYASLSKLLKFKARLQNGEEVEDLLLLSNIVIAWTCVDSLLKKQAVLDLLAKNELDLEEDLVQQLRLYVANESDQELDSQQRQDLELAGDLADLLNERLVT